MIIENKKNKANYVNFKESGVCRKILIPAQKIINIKEIINKTQIINQGDFQRGFFAIIEEVVEMKEEIVIKISEKVKFKDAFEEIKKEVREYADNKNK